MSISNQTVLEYVNDVLSSKPVPGGGSVAALIGSQGAALAGMLVALTTAKKVFQSFDPELQAEFIRLGEFYASQKDRLLQLSGEDVDAYAEVLAAVRLPKDTDLEKADRHARMQAAQRRAALVPLETARTALAGLEQIKPVVAHGNVNAISDGAIGALCLDLAVRGGVYNVRINLPGLEDQAEAALLSEECRRMTDKSEALKAEITAVVESRLA